MGSNYHEFDISLNLLCKYIISNNLSTITDSYKNINIGTGTSSFNLTTDINEKPLTLGYKINDSTDISTYCVAYYIESPNTITVPAWAKKIRAVLVGAGGRGGDGTPAQVTTYYNQTDVNLQLNYNVHQVTIETDWDNGNYIRYYTYALGYLKKSNQNNYNTHPTIHVHEETKQGTNFPRGLHIDSIGNYTPTENLKQTRNVYINPYAQTDDTNTWYASTDISYNFIDKTSPQTQHIHTVTYTYANGNAGAYGGGGAFVYIPSYQINSSSQITVTEQNVSLKIGNVLINAE